jgi:hypothetical protein
VSATKPFSVLPMMPARAAGRRWQSRQVVVTPEQLGMRSAAECQQRAEQLGLTPLPEVAYRQEHWRLDVLLLWSRANGLDRLPMLGHLSTSPRR